MKCPNCHNEETKVIDSRASEKDIAVRRRRKCASCDFRFSTVEKMEILDLTVIKSENKEPQRYDARKVRTGIEKACMKRKMSKEDIDQLMTKVETKIQRKAKGGQVKTSQIGSIILRELKKKDSVAYIRFASIYRNFKDLETFQTELEKIT